MHNFDSKEIFIPSLLTKVLTSKVTQLIVNPRCDIAGFSNEVFHDRIDQGIDSVRNSFSSAFIKDEESLLIFLDRMLDVFFRLFCQAVVPPLQKFTCES